jgi:quercetin dioxygenase-like cupin family protein
MKPFSTMLVLLATAPAALTLLAQEQSTGSSTSTTHEAMAPNDIKWGAAPPTLPAGMQMAVLAGDPTKPGIFTVRLKAPAGFKIPLHTHPTDEGVTVISGNVAFTMGGASAPAHTLPAGGFVMMPAGMQHSATMTGESIVQVTAQGPFVINYVNPADDPSRKK